MHILRNLKSFLENLMSNRIDHHHDLAANRNDCLGLAASHT